MGCRHNSRCEKWDVVIILVAKIVIVVAFVIIVMVVVVCCLSSIKKERFSSFENTVRRRTDGRTASSGHTYLNVTFLQNDRPAGGRCRECPNKRNKLRKRGVSAVGKKKLAWSFDTRSQPPISSSSNPPLAPTSAYSPPPRLERPVPQPEAVKRSEMDNEKLCITAYTW